MPKHIAISIDSIFEWCSKNNSGIGDCCNRYFKLLGELLELQVKSNIPIFTVYLLPHFEEFTDEHIIFSGFMAEFFSELSNNPIVSGRKIKISIFGKWYNLPGKAVESVKRAIENTKEYDNFFINFCINYDGQDEIVDACRLVAKQVELGKIDPEMIAKESIKENIYSSYFIPPDIILVYGERRLRGLLLWDSANSRIEFADKPFMEFEEGDIVKLLF